MLADYILDVMGETRIDKASNAFVMNYGVLNGYAGAMLQPAYARRFKGYGEDSLERIAAAYRRRMPPGLKPSLLPVKLLKTVFS